MAVLDIPKKSFEIVLVLCRDLMLFALEWRVFDIDAAVFAPVFGLELDISIRYLVDYRIPLFW